MGIIWCHLCPTPSNRPLWKRKLICPIRFLKPHQLHQCHLECNPRASKLVEKKYGKVDFMFELFSTSWWPWFFWAEYEAESGTLDSVSSTVTGGLGKRRHCASQRGFEICFVKSRLFLKTASNLLEWPSEWAVVPNTTCPIDWSLQLLHLVDALHRSLKKVSEDILRWWTLVVDSSPHFTTESSHGITEVLETCLSYRSAMFRHFSDLSDVESCVSGGLERFLVSAWKGWNRSRESWCSNTRCIIGKPALYRLYQLIIVRSSHHHMKIQTKCCYLSNWAVFHAVGPPLSPARLPFGQHFGWCRPMTSSRHVFVSNASSTPGGYSCHALYTSRDCSCLGSWRNLPGPLAPVVALWHCDFFVVVFQYFGRFPIPGKCCNMLRIHRIYIESTWIIPKFIEYHIRPQTSQFSGSRTFHLVDVTLPLHPPNRWNWDVSGFRFLHPKDCHLTFIKMIYWHHIKIYDLWPFILQAFWDQKLRGKRW